MIRVGGFIVCLAIVAALAGPVLWPHDPTTQELARRLEAPSLSHPLGLDELGRDILARLLQGARISLMVGLAVVSVSSTAGMAAPSGSDLNPARLDGRIQAPSVPENGVVYATLERSLLDGDLVVPLSAIVTREGRVSGLELLNKMQDRREVTDIVEALSRGRLEPAQFGGSPVAVNLVWLVAHTTVKGKARS